MKLLLPGMNESKYGRIINVISTSVKQPLVGLGVSNTVRGAVASWAKTLANELGPFNITVNNVLPGATNTARLEAIIKNKAAKKGVSIEDMAFEEKSIIPMRRFGEPEEFADRPSDHLVKDASVHDQAFCQVCVQTNSVIAKMKHVDYTLHPI